MPEGSCFLAFLYYVEEARLFFQLETKRFVSKPESGFIFLVPYSRVTDLCMRTLPFSNLWSDVVVVVFFLDSGVRARRSLYRINQALLLLRIRSGNLLRTEEPQLEFLVVIE